MDKANKSTGTGHLRTGAASQQKTSTMEPPKRVAKTGRNPIPIRHTLTSKLRMEKANPLLTLKFVPGTCEPSTSCMTEISSRRSTFHSGMWQMKQNPGLRNTGPVSECKPTAKKRIISNEKKNIVNNEKKNIRCHSKENKPSFVSTCRKGNLSDEFGSATSKLQNTYATARSLPSSLRKKPFSTSIQIKNSTVVQNKSVLTSTRNKSIPHKIKNIKPVNNPSEKSKPQNRNKTQAMEYRKPLTKSSSVDQGIQNSKSNKPVNTPVRKQLKSILRKSASISDLRKITVKEEHVGQTGRDIQPTLKEKYLNRSIKSVAFYSPLRNSTLTPVNLANTPTPAVLRKRLEEWLVKRGKSSYSYRHLCCFGLPQTASVLPKVNQSRGESCLSKTVTASKVDQNGEARLNETITLESSDSTVILSQSFEKDAEDNIESSTPNGSFTTQQDTTYTDEDKENIAHLAHPDALNDLRQLVHSGYPRDQCEQWLNLISQSHPAVKELPHYWECLAALEEAREDFSSAVDCYGQAIVKGADAQHVDKRLDELWEKFSSLSVSAVENKRTPLKKLAVDTKQIFKSTVIKFALQQKAVKKSDKTADISMKDVNYIVTPVRRSSRRSQSLFRTTPTIKCVNTLEDLEQNIRETMVFRGNTVLNPGC